MCVSPTVLSLAVCLGHRVLTSRVSPQREGERSAHHVELPGYEEPFVRVLYVVVDTEPHWDLHGPGYIPRIPPRGGELSPSPQQLRMPRHACVSSHWSLAQRGPNSLASGHPPATSNVLRGRPPMQSRSFGDRPDHRCRRKLHRAPRLHARPPAARTGETHRQRDLSSSNSSRKLGGRSSTLLRRAEDDVSWSDHAGPTQASRASNGLHDAMCVSGLASGSTELLDVIVASSGGRPMAPRAAANAQRQE